MCSDPADFTYCTALSGTQLNETASVPDTFAYTPAAGTVLSAGVGQTLSVTFTPTDAANYTTATRSEERRVGKASPTLTWSDPAEQAIGTAPSGIQQYATYHVPSTVIVSAVGDLDATATT